MAITSPRLHLIDADVRALQAELEEPSALAEELGVSVPANWPPEFYDADATKYTLAQLREHPEQRPWRMYYFTARHDGRAELIGCGGYKGPPGNGVVEIGYSVLEQFRRRGYASEATQALCDNAFADDAVNAVVAETLPELVPSIGVLARCGFTLMGEGSEPGVIRFQLTREHWLQHRHASAAQTTH